jgi:hypothetical protein
MVILLHSLDRVTIVAHMDGIEILCSDCLALASANGTIFVGQFYYSDYVLSTRPPQELEQASDLGRNFW